jgi:hypothetical protein
MSKGKIGSVLLIVAAVTLIGYLFLNNYKLRQIVHNYEHLAALNEAYTDSLTTEYNQKTGEWESSRKAYIAEKAVLDKFLDEKEQELAKLRKKGAVTGGTVDTETKIDTVVVTKNLPDSITRVATIDALPHYEATIVSTPDSTKLKLMAYTHLSYDITDGKMNITHDNPYLTVKNARGFYILPKQKKSKFWQGAAVGAAAVIGGIIILK